MSDVAVGELGDGEPVLVLAGFPFGAHTFRGLTPLLATRFRAIVVDLTPLAASSLATQADAVRALLERLGVARVAIVAHGTGGGVAQLLAFSGRDGGADVDAMVLLDTIAFDTWPVFPEDVAAALEQAHVEDLDRSDADTYLAPWIADTGAYQRGRQALAGEDLLGLEPAMAAWEQPVLLLWGEDDRLVPVAVAERLNDAIPASTLGLVPDSGHLLLDDAFASVGEMIVEYLRARYLRASHDHGGITMLQLERRPPGIDPAPYEEDDDEAAPVDPAQQEVGPNA
jgi:pimeloyl-ACP methyl ester carboxylesterase